MAGPTAAPLPPFLQLPGEVRNLIYEYALSNSSTERNRPYTCLEVRHPTYRTAPSFLNIWSIQGFNQLQYVCRTVREETKSLELKFNTITFEHDVAYGVATREFLDFTKLMTTAKCAWISSVILRSKISPSKGSSRLHKETLLEPVEDFISIASFCRRHPRTFVRYLLPGPDYGVVDKAMHQGMGAVRFMIRACETISTLRDAPEKGPILVPVVYSFTRRSRFRTGRKRRDLRDQVLEWRNGHNAQEWNAPNFRILLDERYADLWMQEKVGHLADAFWKYFEQGHASSNDRWLDWRKNGI